MFGTGLANFDLSIYAKLSIGKVVGELFIVLCLIVNTIVMLNFFIAILADTYTKLSKQSLGLYYDGLIARIPIYEDDKQYGGLIVGIPPFNMLALLMLPFCLCVKDEDKLMYVNDVFTKVIFAPVAIILTVLFLALSLLCLPFAYLAAIFKKIKLIINVKGKVKRKKAHGVK